MRAETQRPPGRHGLPVTEPDLGSSATGNLHTEGINTHVVQTVKQAFDGGIRFFDTAPFYGCGSSERRLGDVLRAEGLLHRNAPTRLLRRGRFA